MRPSAASISCEEVLGVLLEPPVELAHERVGRAVGEWSPDADREVAGLLEQGAFVVDGRERMS